MATKRQKTKYFLQFMFVIVIFLVISYFVQSNISFFRENINNGFWGILAYIVFIQLSIIFAPLSSIPLSPVASVVFGPFTTGIINVFSWTLGAVIVFYICRKWGVELIERMISLEDIHKFESKIPDEDEFWSIVLLRMIIPVDIMSYGLGLFSEINFKDYFWSTLIGVIPFAFLIAYMGVLPFIYQVLTALLFGIIILGIFILRKSKF